MLKSFAEPYLSNCISVVNSYMCVHVYRLGPNKSGPSPGPQAARPGGDVYFPSSSTEDDAVACVLLQAMVPSARNQESACGYFSNRLETTVKLWAEIIISDELDALDIPCGRWGCVKSHR